jgi:transposase-like protein
MTLFPETFQDFMDQLATEDACRSYLASVRWPTGFVCPRCAHAAAWKKASGIFRCRGCLRDISVTAGTTFHGRHLPLRIWFQALWLVVSQKNGVSALGLSRSLGLSRQKTGWELLGTIRTAMKQGGRDKLRGTVEVDEVFVGGVKSGKRGRGALGKALVLVAIEDKDGVGIGRIRMTVIPDATAVSLRTAIESMIEKGSTLRTDEFRGYPSITEHGYLHTQMKKQSLLPGEDPTPLVHRIASLLKRWLLGTHQGGVHLENLPNYLNEFVFRFNRRKSASRGKLFYRLVQGMCGVSDAKG